MNGRPSGFEPALPVQLLPLVIGVLGFTPAVLLVAGAGRWLRGLLGRRRARRRTASWQLSVPGAAGPPSRSPATGRPELPGRRHQRVERAVPMLVGLLAGTVLPGVAGVLGGVLLALLLWRVRPGRRAVLRRAAREQELLLAQLPLTAELLAACLGSSAAPDQAAEAVARTIGNPMESRLTGVAAELALGAPPVAVWERLGDESPALAPLARCLVRTTISGTPPAASLAGLAVVQRAAATRAAHARVRRAGVLATAPLGLCFLPAFVLIGVVPVVVGLAAAFGRQL
ncbi:type II secretion system F family protein [Kitasatospora sp. LaBMicrA B282]|uniref:type II secretion system F family protein n=1 Tax=Kitasatospora sp. LaBMicrA B282 TaxID=3420949 RepID=UPI003D0D8F8E